MHLSQAPNVDSLNRVITVTVESGSEGRVKHVVMINCGGTMDIVDFLDPPDDVVC